MKPEESSLWTWSASASGLVVSLVVLLWLVAACKAEERQTRRARPPVKAEPSERPRVPSFENDIQPVFTLNCSARGCHGDLPTDKVQLDLRPDNAYDALVGQPAKGRPNAVRVVPRDPDASFLVAKMLGHLAASEGKAMPIDPETGEIFAMTPPAAEFVELLLRPWIEAGAPRD
jgi:hypothetical protein